MNVGGLCQEDQFAAGRIALITAEQRDQPAGMPSDALQEERVRAINTQAHRILRAASGVEQPGFDSIRKIAIIIVNDGAPRIPHCAEMCVSQKTGATAQAAGARSDSEVIPPGWAECVRVTVPFECDRFVFPRSAQDRNGAGVGLVIAGITTSSSKNTPAAICELTKSSGSLFISRKSPLFLQSIKIL